MKNTTRHLGVALLGRYTKYYQISSLSTNFSRWPPHHTRTRLGRSCSHYLQHSYSPYPHFLPHHKFSCMSIIYFLCCLEGSWKFNLTWRLCGDKVLGLCQEIVVPSANLTHNILVPLFFLIQVFTWSLFTWEQCCQT